MQPLNCKIVLSAGAGSGVFSRIVLACGDAGTPRMRKSIFVQ